MGELLFPVEIKPVSGAVIFLAGPIQGAPNWHEEAIEILQHANPEVHIASPRRRVVEPNAFEGRDYYRQVEWETHYLERAAKFGVIAFWLAKESEHLCDRAYAQTSRFELGEWTVRAALGEAVVVVGIEEGFTNARYLEHRLQGKRNVHFYTNLKGVCGLALKLSLDKLYPDKTTLLS